VNLMKDARVAIGEGRFLEFRRSKLEAWAEAIPQAD